MSLKIQMSPCPHVKTLVSIVCAFQKPGARKDGLRHQDDGLA